MRLKIKNIWKIFLSTAISASMAATNAFAFVTIRKGDVDTETLQREYRAANPTKSSIKILSSPFVKGKTVYNAYNRADNKFDFIHGEADAANMGNTMTYAHAAIFSTSLLSCVCTGATNANRFSYPISNSKEFALIDKLIKTIHAKIHTPGTTDDDKNSYVSLLKLIQLAESHIWFLRCPESYGTCKQTWANRRQNINHRKPFFHKIGSEFVDNDGKVRIGYAMGRSTIPGTVFGSIGHPGLRKNLIEAFTIIECAWESNVFENGENSLDTSSDTQRSYDMLNEALRALLMYGLGEIGAANGKQLAEYYNSFLPKKEQVNAETTTIQNIYDALATSLGNAIEAVKGCYQIGNGVSNIIEWRCEVERYTSGRIKSRWKKAFKELVKDKDDLLVWPKGVPRPQTPAAPADLTPPPAKRPRVGAPPALNQGQQQQYLPAITGPNTYVSPIQQNEIYAPVALQQQPLMPGQYLQLDQGQQQYPPVTFYILQDTTPQITADSHYISAQDNATDPFSGLPCNLGQQQDQHNAQYNTTNLFSGLPYNPSQPPLEPDNATYDDYSSPSSSAFPEDSHGPSSSAFPDNGFRLDNGTDTLNDHNIFELDDGTDILNRYDIFEPDNATDDDYSSPSSPAFSSPNRDN